MLANDTTHAHSTNAGRDAHHAKTLAGPRMFLKPDDQRFPAALLSIPRPPKSLWAIGSVDAFAEGISIIGARKATPYGQGCARRFARIAASLGVTVVSGGALGCDSEAHRGALEAGGTTLAILGGGCDQLYPARNRPLFQQIIDAGGAVASEHDWNDPPLPWMFRERNRLIAGLSKATLVVEAGLPSGTFSTADEALIAGKDVLVVPGPITSPTSSGSNRLIAQGAMPIVDDESFEDVLSSLFGTLKHSVSTEQVLQNDDPLIAALMACPMRIDEMLDKGLATDHVKLSLDLARYEKSGIISRYPDARYGPSQAWIAR